jgi:hypothetical protein
MQFMLSDIKILLNKECFINVTSPTVVQSARQEKIFAANAVDTVLMFSSTRPGRSLPAISIQYSCGRVTIALNNGNYIRFSPEYIGHLVEKLVEYEEEMKSLIIEGNKNAVPNTKLYRA